MMQYYHAKKHAQNSQHLSRMAQNSGSACAQQGEVTNQVFAKESACIRGYPHQQETPTYSVVTHLSGVDVFDQ